MSRSDSWLQGELTKDLSDDRTRCSNPVIFRLIKGREAVEQGHCLVTQGVALLQVEAAANWVFPCQGSQEVLDGTDRATVRALAGVNLRSSIAQDSDSELIIRVL